MQEKRETRGEDEAILRPWLKRTRTSSENTKEKDQKDERWRSRLGKSSDGPAKKHKSREQGKVGHSCFGFDKARRRAFICKADSRHHETSILHAK